MQRMLQKKQIMYCMTRHRSLQLVSKPLSAAIGCKARGSAFSAKRVLNVPQHASVCRAAPGNWTGRNKDMSYMNGLREIFITPKLGELR